ncbi:carbohydrate ABC transporter permease [Ancylobacter polymorphus]|uniref:Carbohydrate ABC transporter permease n=1 Tax=Ancylobacter polymorphus TaxID=223390 RepID=A0A9E7D7F6_9HYPH|nr:carbohydrate ABC transporter permease [Ancylobacter polymorphus]UOK73445.1 carbohydrate ABC transporter permease [Ancylobacter polymorphus]
MRMTTIHAQAERKRQDRSVCRAEKRLCRARMLRVRGLIHPTSAVCATTDTARGEKRLPSEQNQAILKSSGRPLGECRLSSLLNSTLMATGTIIVSMILSAFIAYGATRLRFRGKTILIASMLFAYMFPPLMLAIPMAAVFRSIGLADSLWGLLIAHLAISLPLGVWLLWGFFKSMPFDLEEAAMVDGCSQFGAFFRVVLPLSAPGLITVGIFSFLLSWADYVFALILIMSDQKKTLPVALASMLGAQDLRWGEILAGSSLIALPLFVVFAFCYRYFVAGLSAGAVKG